MSRARGFSHNLNTSEERELPYIFKFVAVELEKHGIETDLLKAKITRIDSFRNFTTEYPLVDYHPLIRSLNIKWQRELNSFKDTLYFKRDGLEVVIYNKHKELIDKGHTDATEDKNLQRLEFRLRSTKKIQKILNVNTLSDLLKKSDVISSAYQSFMLENLFKWEIPVIDYAKIITSVDQMRYFKTKHPKSFMTKFFEAHFAFFHNRSAKFLSICQHELKLNRSTICQRRKKLEQGYLDFLVSSPITKDAHRYGDMYLELKSKSLGVETLTINLENAA